MRAAVITRYGPARDVTVSDAVPEPDLGPEGVRVRVAAAGLNPIDWKLVTGALPEVPQRDGEGRYVLRITEANRFVPGHALVPNGSTVRWLNEGGTHDVTAANGSWSSDDEGEKLRPGDSFERTFDAPGLHEYVCDLHEVLGMRGIVEVLSSGNDSGDRALHLS